jgi:endonuclease/exonuclease/phosphatase family metal-dependent hydrolase
MVTVGTWNLENLFRPGSESGPDTEQDYEAKLTALADTITALGPDVLAVQEVGDPAALGDLVAKLTDPDGWTVVLSAHPDVRGIRVGFLTRIEPVATADVLDFPALLRPVQDGDAPGDTSAAMGRGGLNLRIQVDGQSWDLVTVHLKSKLLTFPGGRFSPKDEGERARFAAYALYRRAAEATTVREHANTALDGPGQDRPLIVLGDLNDTPAAATTQLLYGPPGSQFGTDGFNQPDKGDAWRLWNLAQQIPAEHRFSRIFEGQGELIDHILISHALLDRLVAVDADITGLASIGTNPNARRNKPGSDHAPLIAHFN